MTFTNAFIFTSRLYKNFFNENFAFLRKIFTKLNIVREKFVIKRTFSKSCQWQVLNRDSAEAKVTKCYVS